MNIRAGGWLGMGNDPVYVKSKVFDPFPFPSPGELLRAQIRSMAEELDAFRKQRQKEHPSLTLTQMYNVLEKLKAIEAARKITSLSTRSADGSESTDDSSAAVTELTADDERIKDEGLVLILKEMHEKLDRLVFQAYGWPEMLSEEEILAKLIALNHERAAKERCGHVYWLRPDYQIPRFAKDIDKQAAKEEGEPVRSNRLARAQGRLNLPVNVAACPCAFACKHQSDARVLDVLDTNPVHYVICIGTVNDIFRHRSKLSRNENIVAFIKSLYKSIHIILVCMMITDEALTTNCHRLLP